eukprot:1195795-Rhodomonas_salina.2
MKTLHTGPAIAKSDWVQVPIIYYSQATCPAHHEHRQADAWYWFCGVQDELYCSRMDIFQIGVDKTVLLYQSELAEMLAYSEGPCGTERFTCFIANGAFSPGLLEGVEPQFFEAWQTTRAKAETVRAQALAEALARPPCWHAPRVPPSAQYYGITLRQTGSLRGLPAALQDQAGGSGTEPCLSPPPHLDASGTHHHR